MKNIIKDNCINPNYQNLLESTMRYDTEFRWVYHDNLSEDGESQLVGFSHMFILNGNSTSKYSGMFLPLVFEACHNTGISISKVIRGRCFLQTPGVRTKEYDSMHVDLPDPHLVCLYYASDSDGDTYFSERMYGAPLAEYPINSTVSPVKGRCVFFDGLRYHSSSVPTKKPRFVINFNFLP